MFSQAFRGGKLLTQPEERKLFSIKPVRRLMYKTQTLNKRKQHYVDVYFEVGFHWRCRQLHVRMALRGLGEALRRDYYAER